MYKSRSLFENALGANQEAVLPDGGVNISPESVLGHGLWSKLSLTGKVKPTPSPLRSPPPSTPTTKNSVVSPVSTLETCSPIQTPLKKSKREQYTPASCVGGYPAVSA